MARSTRKPRSAPVGQTPQYEPSVNAPDPLDAGVKRLGIGIAAVIIIGLFLLFFVMGFSGIASTVLNTGGGAQGCQAGYSWCAEKAKCVQIGMEQCMPSIAPLTEGATDGHGCALTSGYAWCPDSQKCVRSWEEPCPSAGQLTGAQADRYGCLAAAGYVWCSETGKCIRPWEENCKFSQIVSIGRDSHGCIPSAGYTWCNSTRQCIKAWEGECGIPAEEAAPGGGSGSAGGQNGTAGNATTDEHGCIVSAGYAWCEEMQICLRPWEQNCTGSLPPGNITDEHGCLVSAGYSWCDTMQTCIAQGAICYTYEELEAQVYCGGGVRVYVCTDYIKVVGATPGEGSVLYPIGGGDPIQCPILDPVSLPEECYEPMAYCYERNVC